MSVVAAALAAIGNVVALLHVDGVYGRETTAFIDQAVAQDVVDLVVVAPATVLLALMAGRGSLSARLLWLGTVSFTVYNYVIYTMSVHAGPLFLLWVAVLGLALYALIGGLATLDRHAVAARSADVPRRTAGWFLVVVATLFTALWLRDIVPALLFGEVPDGARELGLPSNPVHVLDLAFYLPAAFAAGIGLLRRQAWGDSLAPGLLVFVVLTGLPIIITPFVSAARGGEPAWGVVAPLAVITVASLAVLVRLLLPAHHPIPSGGLTHA